MWNNFVELYVWGILLYGRGTWIITDQDKKKSNKQWKCGFGEDYKILAGL